MDVQLTPGEAADLGFFFRAHAKALFGYACVLTRGDLGSADGLVQQTFRAVAPVWPSLRDVPDQEARTWLRGTMQHIAASELRRNELTGRVPGQLKQPHHAPEAERDTLPPIALERYWQVIDQMPARQHLIAVMRWRGDMKPSEIAAVLDMSPDAVSSQIHDAQKKLFAGLKERAPFAQDDMKEPIANPGEGGATA